MLSAFGKYADFVLYFCFVAEREKGCTIEQVLRECLVIYNAWDIRTNELHISANLHTLAEHRLMHLNIM